ncbi:hypothetical protein RRG08_032589 [Elysia crispata]|uniref:Uncharacterized protein n=1 Tax=Elysia crispata TaxID=231223 RepID=A0AAE0ZYT9_9GAST|nr:hypothetical protein RRG08_032589 [Elysia crispata]
MNEQEELECQIHASKITRIRHGESDSASLKVCERERCETQRELRCMDQKCMSEEAALNQQIHKLKCELEQELSCRRNLEYQIASKDQLINSLRSFFLYKIKGFSLQLVTVSSEVHGARFCFPLDLGLMVRFAREFSQISRYSFVRNLKDRFRLISNILEFRFILLVMPVCLLVGPLNPFLCLPPSRSA